MIGFIQSLLAFVVALGALITFHEYGHYWVAKKFNVKILRFSVGFGRPLYKKLFGTDNTEFIIAALPLGGYVKMLDEREGEVKAEDKHREFCQKPIWQRFLIVVAGPIFNFIFAIVAYWCVFIIGIYGLKPYIGEIEVNSISERAGVVQGQQIVSVDGIITPSWSAVIDRLVEHAVNAEKIELGVVDNDGVKKIISFDLSTISIDDMAEGKLLETLGLSVIEFKLPAVIGQIIAEGAAERAGLLKGDKIISVNNVEITRWGEWVDVVRDNPLRSLSVKIQRNDVLQTINITPENVERDGEMIGRIGAAPEPVSGMFDKYFTRESYSVIDASIKAVEKTWDMSILTLQILGKMIIGEASVKNLSGPISIAQYAGQSASIGIVPFLMFMAMVSVSLGVLNLLPIPVLDGGHLFYYIIEFILGKPVSASVQIWGQQFGIVILLSLMGIALYNDLTRLFG